MNGFAVIENFFEDLEANELRDAGLKLVDAAPETDRKKFNTKDRNQCKDVIGYCLQFLILLPLLPVVFYINRFCPSFQNYFLDSANKIHYFYESDALDDNGNLLVEKINALNKVRLSVKASS